MISLEYHETLSAAFGEQAEDNKHNAIKQYYGKYVLVVDGSIPVKDGGVYCMVAGKPIVEHIQEAAKGLPRLSRSVLVQHGVAYLLAVATQLAQAAYLKYYQKARL